MPLILHQYDLEDPQREQLLAMQWLRRVVERRPAARRARGPNVALSGRELVRSLREVIAALDRRAPRPERATEKTISDDAAALRAEAVNRLSQINDDGAGERDSARR